MKNFSNYFSQMKNHALAILSVIAAGLFLAPANLSAGVSEPDTIFYGKIINRTAGPEYVLTQGTLVWTISRPDGKQMTLSAPVVSISGGVYSYQLLVPQEALAFGLSVSSNSIPLPSEKTTCSHLQITVDGIAASIMAPGSSFFDVAQNIRGATHRLDLELGNSLTDTGNTGIPDWWKTKYGLLDPNADSDGDGWSNLQEYLQGSDPNQDNRIPSLETKELFVYADGATGIRLNAIDSDSTPANLFYTLTALPTGGKLFLRDSIPNGTNGAAVLDIGAVFTQEQINKGALVFVYGPTNDAVTTSFSVSLHDETPAHPTTNGTVALNIYRPNYSSGIAQLAKDAAAAPVGFDDVAGLPFFEQQMLINYYLSRDEGYLIWDLSRGSVAQDVSVSSSGLSEAQYAIYKATYGADRQHVIIGGSGEDRLNGGMENDIIIGTAGDTLRGNGGSDLFIVPNVNVGNLVIRDFSTNETDSLDLSRVLTGTSTVLTNYLRITTASTNSYLEICTNGTGNGYTNLIVTLEGTQLAQSNLRSLMDNGNLLAGDKVIAPQISIVATIPGASQNGPVAGEFTLTRVGSGHSALTINLNISGSAINGVDYESIPATATFAAGERTLKLQITPYANAATFAKTVQISIPSGTGYELASSSAAMLSIEPLAPQLSIEAIQPTAVKGDSFAGQFLISRGGAIDRSVLAKLTISGTAANGIDYTLVSSTVSFAANQTYAFVEIAPKSTATLANGMEFVQLTIKPDASYKIMGQSTAHVLIVDQLYDLTTWQQRFFSGSASDKWAFANEDSGHKGIKNIFRYAFGLDPNAPENSKGLPVFKMVDDHLTVSFKQPASVTDVEYDVQTSEDLQTWRTINVEQFFPADATNDVETVYFRSTDSVKSTPKSFMRVLVVPQ
jgi:hypothetical protein